MLRMLRRVKHSETRDWEVETYLYTLFLGWDTREGVESHSVTVARQKVGPSSHSLARRVSAPNIPRCRKGLRESLCCWKTKLPIVQI